MKLTNRERATILSALRLSQWHLYAGSLEGMLKERDCQARCEAIDGIADAVKGGALTLEEIDALCIKLNMED